MSDTRAEQGYERVARGLEIELERAKAIQSRIEAERDRLRAEVAALRAAWPTGRQGGPMPVGLIMELGDDQWYVVPDPSVGIRGYVHPSRDAAINAAAGLDHTCKTAEGST